LDIAKNNAIHIFAPISLASSAILAALVREKHFDQVTMSVRVKEAAAEYAFIRNLLGDEFRFPGAEAGDEAALLDTLRYFLDRDLLEHDAKEGVLRITARQDFFGRTSMKTLLLYSLLTYNFLESYYLVLDSLGAMEPRTMDARAFVNFAFTRGSKIFAVGNIIKREAILKVPLENAYRHFKSDGMISEEEPEVKKRGKAKGGVLVLSPEQNVRRLQIMSQLRGFFEYHKQRFLGI
jgi:glycerol-3-phosphate O-acyltransferase